MSIINSDCKPIGRYAAVNPAPQQSESGIIACVQSLTAEGGIMECSRRISLRYSNRRSFWLRLGSSVRAAARATAGVGVSPQEKALQTRLKLKVNDDESRADFGMGCRYSVPLPRCCVQVGGRKWQLAIS